MERGVRAGDAIRRLAKERDLSQNKMEKKTQIGHSTMSGYWSNRLRLGLDNGAKIAAALEVSLEELGFRATEVSDREWEVARLQEEVARQGELIGHLAEQVEDLRRARTPRRATPRPKR